MDSLIERIQLLAHHKNFEQADLARALGKSPAMINRWWKGKQKPGPKNIREISEFFQCSLEWLKTGKGDPFLAAPTDGKTGENQKSDLEDLIPVAYIEDTYASAGGGIINYEAARQVMTFDRGFLTAQLGIQRFDNIHVIHAVGDSMEPTIRPGDMLFINPGEKEIVTGAVYVFVIGEETMVKRIEHNPLTKALTLRSDNEHYEPLRIDKDNLDKVQVIGRVIGNFRKF